MRWVRWAGHVCLVVSRGTSIPPTNMGATAWGPHTHGLVASCLPEEKKTNFFLFFICALETPFASFVEDAHYLRVWLGLSTRPEYWSLQLWIANIYLPNNYWRKKTKIMCLINILFGRLGSQIRKSLF